METAHGTFHPVYSVGVFALSTQICCQTLLGSHGATPDAQFMNGDFITNPEMFAIQEDFYLMSKNIHPHRIVFNRSMCGTTTGSISPLNFTWMNVTHGADRPSFTEPETAAVTDYRRLSGHRMSESHYQRVCSGSKLKSIVWTNSRSGVIDPSPPNQVRRCATFDLVIS